MSLEDIAKQRYEPHNSKRGFKRGLIGLGIFAIGSLFSYGCVDEFVALGGATLFGYNLSQSWDYLKYKLLGK